jgi:di/tricarboxylate transporter
MRAMPVARPVAAVASLSALVLLGASLVTADGAITLRAAALVVFTVGLLSTGVVSTTLALLLFFFLAVMLETAPPIVVFSGFHSGAAWLVFSGLVIGLAVQRSGVGGRIVALMLRWFPPTYAGVIAGIVLVGVVLAFLVPTAMGRVMLLIPIALALAERVGLAEGSRGRAGMVLAAALGTQTPAFAILPSNVPNVAMLGAAESIFGVTFSYGEYLLLHFPVLAVGSALTLVVGITVLFRDSVGVAVDPEPGSVASVGERRLLLYLAAAIVLWFTDFAHGIAPAWIGLGLALLCLLPRVGVLPATALARDIDYGPWIFVAGIIGMGAVANDSGLGAVLADALVRVVPFAPGADFLNYFAIVLIGMAVAVVTVLPGATAILSPLAADLAAVTGWTLESVLVAQVPSWTFFALPYEAPPLVVAMALGGVTIAQAMRALGVHFLVGIVLIVPMQFYWGRWLGWYGGY